MSRLTKHTATLVKKHFVHFLTLTVMLALLVSPVYASNGIPVSKVNSQLENHDPLIAGKDGRFHKLTIPPRPPLPEETINAWMFKEMQEYPISVEKGRVGASDAKSRLLAGIGLRKPNRRAPPKKILTAPKAELDGGEKSFLLAGVGARKTSRRPPPKKILAAAKR